MNIHEARSQLSRQLMFGDAQQIMAVAVVEVHDRLRDIDHQLEELRRECPSCEGCCETECWNCGHDMDCDERRLGYIYPDDKEELIEALEDERRELEETAKRNR